VDAVLIKLADLPPNVSAKATERALHIAFEYPSQVEVRIRELAQEHLDRIDIAIRRMEAVMAAIHQALNPKPRLRDDYTRHEGEAALPDHEVHELQRTGGLCQAVLRLGLSRGFIKPDQMLDPDDPTLPKEEPSYGR
jgi:hypothetical protein